MVSIHTYYNSSWFVTRERICPNLLNRILIIREWLTVFITDAKSKGLYVKPFHLLL